MDKTVKEAFVLDDNRHQILQKEICRFIKARGGGQTFAMPTFCPVNYNHMLKCPPQPTEFH